MTEDSLEQVKAEIAQLKAEQVFACTSDAIDETGYGEELVCLCRDPEVKPWTRCPIHDTPVD